MSSTRLNLLVLRSNNVHALVEFYQAAGLDFVQEQHGSGPVHFACERGGMVIEIYPSTYGSTVDRKAGGATMLGFAVASLASTLEAMKGLKVEFVSPPKDMPWGKRAVVLDPDGRAVDFTEPKSG
jgi:lactoylglutathione lyase